MGTHLPSTVLAATGPQAQSARAVSQPPRVVRPVSAPASAVAVNRGAKRTLYTKNGKHPVAKPRFAGRGGGLQCVPFARNASGIVLSGNAWQWWDRAAGLYARGNAPEEGAILSFQSNGSMKLGHVAVVARVVNARQIEIDHANWAGPGGRKGLVTRGAAVVDVSDDNDWTAVRVALGRAGDFGSIYPTNGFIFDRAETGNIAVATRAPAPAPAPAQDLGPAPRDLRPASERASGYLEVSYANGFVEVAEASVAARPTARTRARKAVRIRR